MSKRPNPDKLLRAMLKARDRDRNPLAKPKRDNVPSFRDKNMPELVEIPTPRGTARDWARHFPAIGAECWRLQCFTFGQCQVMLTKEHDLIHFSISHPSRYPSWDEIAAVRYRLIPTESDAVLVLPPEKEYINVHEFCFQVHETRRGGLEYALNLPGGDASTNGKTEHPSE